MVLSRRWAVFLTGVGVWTWLIWPRFGLAIWQDDRSFADGRPTSFLLVHAVLIGASLAVGTTVGVLGMRAWRYHRRRRVAEDLVAAGPSGPQD
ncbi:SCO4848 family membrane protein [Actinoplanes sp. NPDC051513]|uniref:SCO4848 family membrane protein n=1 Tax=Actinoplanes sp. NPDC051513 TaxID=3363908 RepID=UPI00379DFE5E